MWQVKWMHFPAHVYRSPSVQWTVCMKANVLIYKWVTLGKTWRCGAFSFRYNTSPGSWLSSSPSPRPTVPRKLPRGRLGHVQVKAKFVMICLVSCATFRITPSGFIHSLKWLSASLEMDPDRHSNTVDKGRVRGPVRKGPLHLLRKGGFFFHGRVFPHHTKGALSSSCFSLH